MFDKAILNQIYCLSFVGDNLNLRFIKVQFSNKNFSMEKRPSIGAWSALDVEIRACSLIILSSISDLIYNLFE